MKEKSFAEKFISLDKKEYDTKDILTMFSLANITSGISYRELIEDNGMKTNFDYSDIFSDGIEVKLNYEKIKQRGLDKMTKEYQDFIEDNKDTIFHLQWEDDRYVTFEEDERYCELDGKSVQKPKFLFDPQSDILVKYNDEWTPAYEVRKILLEKSRENK